MSATRKRTTAWRDSRRKTGLARVFRQAQPRKIMKETKLFIRYKIPSLNRLFGMSHWQRLKEKKLALAAVRSASSLTGPDTATLTTLSEDANTFSMPFDDADTSKTMRRPSSRLKCDSSKSQPVA